MRFDKPIGIYLVLWPTLWALWIAAEGQPSWHLFIIFTFGCVLMRAAGCVINDYADRRFDSHVERTRERPLTAGRVSEKEALTLFTILSLCAFVLVLFTNRLTIYLSVAGLFLAIIYPFTKRLISLPQAWLGIAFGWGMPMAFAAQLNLQIFFEIPGVAWQLLIANICWAIAYDSMYAMVDREDDLKIGVKSSAILFGKYDRLIIGLLQISMLILLFDVANKLDFATHAGLWFRLSLFVSAIFMLYQQFLIRNRERGACFQAFLNNHWVGLSLFCGLILEYSLK
jgi:4-hydroxybenzoate polyprenyltransferase